MATHPLVHEAEASRFVPPYPPGWLDRLSEAIKRLPGPEWIYYVALFAVQATWVAFVLWLRTRRR